MTSLKKRTIMILFIILITTIIVALIYFYIDTNKLETTEYQIYSERLPNSFDGFRIMFLSDLHEAEFGKNQTILLEKVKNSEPDIIVVGGDIFSALPENFEKIECLFKQLSKLAPTYYTPGNHESHEGAYYEMLKVISDIDIKILFNQSQTISIGEQSIDIFGLRDPGFAPDIKINKPRDIAKRELAKLIPEKPEKFSVLVSHRPDYIEFYGESGVDVVLTGHAHGGQIRLPFLGAVIAPGQGLFPKLTQGVHYSDETAVVISRGLGVSELLPLRTFNRPELVLVVLRHELNYNEKG